MPEFSDQGKLIDTLESPISRETYGTAMKLCHANARNHGVAIVLEENEIDVIVLHLNSPPPRIATAVGG